VNVTIRRATAEDVEFLVELVNDEGVSPFLAAVRPSDRDGITALVARSRNEPDAFGVYVIEVDGERAGTVEFEVANRRSRIANLGGLAVHPAHRRSGVAHEASRLFQRHLIRELGFHRLQLEVYAFNDRALAQSERAGFVREGVRRKAYWRHGEWVDGVLFGLVEEDLDEGD
jgi:RimJ/RimL family protein N-acetyltransferase